MRRDFYVSAEALIGFAEASGFPLNRRLSTKREARFGTNGSLTIDREASIFYSHEGREGGGGLDFLIWLGIARTRAEAAEILEDGGHIDPDPERAAERERRAAELAERKRIEEAALSAKAWAIFDQAKPLTGADPASCYLAARAIAGPYYASLRCGLIWNAEARRNMAALVAAVTLLETPDAVRGVQRIFIENGRKADVPTPKKAYGKIGGAGVILGPIGDAVVVGEGIETALSASRMIGLPAVATLGAGNMRELIVPAHIRRVVIAGDRDPKGVGERAARDLGERLAARGVDASIALPPEPFKDFNDCAQAQAKGGARG
jgi:hypothetical protein